MKTLYILSVTVLGLRLLAITPSSMRVTANEYYVASETMDYYIITSIPAPSCSPTGSVPCRISTASTPDSQGRIHKTEAVVIAWQAD
jgi:hypothetical protein